LKFYCLIILKNVARIKKEVIMFKNLVKMAQLAAAAASGSLITVLVIIFSTAFDNDTNLHPANNYGEAGTWYHLISDDEFNFNGGYDILVLSGLTQVECHNIKGGGASDGKSIKIYEQLFNSYLPEGMKVYLYWGKRCVGYKPYGVITVPASVKEIIVPNVNRASDNYEVFNNFEKGRKLAGHINGLAWSVP